MALKVFDGVFGELVEVLIDRVKNGEAPDKDKWKEEAKLEAIRALERALVLYLGIDSCLVWPNN
jgi:hypothetical protein